MLQAARSWTGCRCRCESLVRVVALLEVVRLRVKEIVAVDAASSNQSVHPVSLAEGWLRHVPMTVCGGDEPEERGCSQHALEMCACSR